MADYNINELIDKPYSDMTEEEISFVIDYKAEKKASQDTYQKVVDESRAAQEKMISINKETAKIALENLGDLKAKALERLEKASKGEL